ncbi:MAG: hypothetical protein ACP5H2_02220 [Solirubrobacteraceae bacterium]
MTDASTASAEDLSQRLAEHGREALLERLRLAYRAAAAAHSDIVSIEPERLEAMVQNAGDHADGIQWRRALAGLAADELGVSVAEALSHPAVAQAQALVGAPSYEQSLAETVARPVPSPLPTPMLGDERYRPQTGQPQAETRLPEQTLAGGTPGDEPAVAPAVPDAPGDEPTVASAVLDTAGDQGRGWSWGDAPTVTAPQDSGDAANDSDASSASAADHESPPHQGLDAATERYELPVEDDAAGTEPDAILQGGWAESQTPGDNTSTLPAAAAPLAAATPLAAAETDAPAGDDATLKDEELRVRAIHLGGVASLPIGGEGFDLRAWQPGLDIMGLDDHVIGRLPWSEIDTLEVPTPKRHRRAGNAKARLVVRTPQGDASFEIPGMTPQELSVHVQRLLQAHR